MKLNCVKKIKLKTKYLQIDLYNDSEADFYKCSVKKVFLKIPQNSHENTCATGLQLY